MFSALYFQSYVTQWLPNMLPNGIECLIITQTNPSMSVPFQNDNEPIFRVFQYN